MAVRDFLDEWSTLMVGGRRLVVKKPTCRTVVLACALFESELIGLARTHKQIGNLGDDPEAIAVPLFTAKPDALARVLASCTRDAVGQMSEQDVALLLAAQGRKVLTSVVRSLLTVCDITAIARFLSLGDPVEGPSPKPDESGKYDPTPLEIAAMYLSDKFRVTPFQVMEWPFEAVMTAMLYSQIGTEQKPAVGYQIEHAFPVEGMIGYSKSGDADGEI